MRFSIPIAIILGGCIDYGISKSTDGSSYGDETGLSPDSVDSGDGGQDDSPPADSAAPEDPVPDPDTGPDPRPPIDTGDPPTDTATPPIDTGPPPMTTCDELHVDGAVDIDEDCVSEPVTGRIETRIEWSVDGFLDFWEYNEILVSPVVGHMTDDDGDGLIGPGDVPDIVFVADDGGRESSTQGVLRMLSGDGSGDLLTVRHTEFEGSQILIHRYSGVAIGDVDGDGLPDIVTVIEKIPPPEDDPGDAPDIEDPPVGPPPPPGMGSMLPLESGDDESVVFPNCFPALYSAAGDLLWVADEAQIDCGSHAPALADLDGDGEVEVVIGSFILAGLDGHLIALGEGGVGMSGAFVEMGTIPIVVDLDLGGTQEIIAGNTVYGPDGRTICTIDAGDGFTAAADLDGDGQAEIVLVGDGLVTVAEADCSIATSWSLLGTGTGGPPTIADFDADSIPEIGVASATHYSVYEADGTLLWSHAVTDESSHSTGSTVFDFEGDGRPEVVYADEQTLWILDGLTGEVRLSDGGHSSRTIHEYPVVVDVDGDGYPEIVVPNGGGHSTGPMTGLYVLGAADGGAWLGGRTVWNQHAYNMVNINDDLSIPAHPEPNWPLHNNFRSGDVNPVAGALATDAVPLAEVCTLDCEDGVVELVFRIANQGTAILREDLKTTIWSIVSGVWTVVDVIEVSPPIYPGESTDEIRRTYDVADVGADGLAIVVDSLAGVSSVRECDEDNNVLWLPEAACE
jgi:hypothetical protein